MTSLIVMHVLFGITAVSLSYCVVLGLRRSEPRLSFLRFASLAAFLLYIASWAAAGYYYVLQYGKAVKPKIIEGAYPWAHAIFMEAKEHIFLFLPFTALMTAVIIFFLGERLSDDAIRRPLLSLALVTFLLGVFVTLAGVVVSGGA